MQERKPDHTADMLRALDAAEIGAVSGAKGKSYDLGVLGSLYFDEGCAVWTMFTINDDGSFVSTSIGQC